MWGPWGESITVQSVHRLCQKLFNLSICPHPLRFPSTKNHQLSSPHLWEPRRLRRMPVRRLRGPKLHGPVLARSERRSSTPPPPPPAKRTRSLGGLAAFLGKLVFVRNPRLVWSCGLEALWFPIRWLFLNGGSPWLVPSFSHQSCQLHPTPLLSGHKLPTGKTNAIGNQIRTK